VTSWYWITPLTGLGGVLLGYWIDQLRDRRMMRRLNVQPWWPPVGTKPPTNAQRNRRVG
jgi:hypothetical protein